MEQPESIIPYYIDYIVDQDQGGKLAGVVGGQYDSWLGKRGGGLFGSYGGFAPCACALHLLSTWGIGL